MGCGSGHLVNKEAGGVITDFSFNDNYLESGNVIAGSPKMHQLMYQLIEPHVTDNLKISHAEWVKRAVKPFIPNSGKGFADALPNPSSLKLALKQLQRQHDGILSPFSADNSLF